jgi:hypothetical protein
MQTQAFSSSNYTALSLLNLFSVINLFSALSEEKFNLLKTQGFCSFFFLNPYDFIAPDIKMTDALLNDNKLGQVGHSIHLPAWACDPWRLSVLQHFASFL